MAVALHVRRCGVLVGLLALLAQGAGCRKSKLEPETIAWHHDLASARADARTQKKPVVVFYCAAWNTACKMMQEETFSDPEVRALLSHDFIAVEIDGTDDDAPMARKAAPELRIVGVPTTIIFAPDFTTELSRITQYVKPTVLLTTLRAAKERR